MVRQDHQEPRGNTRQGRRDTVGGVVADGGLHRFVEPQLSGLHQRFGQKSWRTVTADRICGPAARRRGQRLLQSEFSETWLRSDYMAAVGKHALTSAQMTADYDQDADVLYV